MYNPLKPTIYLAYKDECYGKRRREEEASAEALRRAREEAGNALSDALAGLSSASSVSRANAPVPDDLPSSLNMTAETLHRLRVKESAARGVQRAVEMEKDSLVLEQKTRKHEGTDTRSKISSRLDRMRKNAQGQDSTSATAGGLGADGGVMAPPAVPLSDGGMAASDAMPAPGLPPSSAPVPAARSAPLAFKRSAMAAGGYVLDTTTSAGGPSSDDPTSSNAATLSGTGTKAALRGKPSSTLLIRFRTHPSPVTIALAGLHEAASAAEVDAVLAPLLETVRQSCGRYGVVRSVRTLVLSASELEAKGRELVGTPDEREACLEMEKLRVLVRLDTVAEAFKTAESIVGVPAQPAATAMFPGTWSVAFFPSNLYDEGLLGPVETEGFC